MTMILQEEEEESCQLEGTFQRACDADIDDLDLSAETMCLIENTIEG